MDPKTIGNGDCRRLQNEELCSLYRSPNMLTVIKYRRIRCARHVVRMEDIKGAFKILTSKLTIKRPLGSPKDRCEDNVRIDLNEIDVNTRNWIDSTQDKNC